MFEMKKYKTSLELIKSGFELGYIQGCGYPWAQSALAIKIKKRYYKANTVIYHKLYSSSRQDKTFLKPMYQHPDRSWASLKILPWHHL